jgi:hypothetical protein
MQGPRNPEPCGVLAGTLNGAKDEGNVAFFNSLLKAGRRSPETMNKMISTVQPLRQRIPMLIWIAAFGVILSGCAGQRLPDPQTRYRSPEAALRALAASTPADQTFTATARIEINHQGERYPLKIAVMMKRPAFLRLESIPLLGPPDFFLSVANDELRVYLPGKNAFYTGRAVPQNISRFFPIFIPAAEMISLLMGIAPDNREESPALRGEQEERYYRVDGYASDRRTRSLWIDPSGNRLVRIRTFMEGETVAYEVAFAEHTLVGESFMPQRVTITGDGIAALSLRYTDLLPIAADPESFPLPLPEGIIPILLDP